MFRSLKDYCRAQHLEACDNIKTELEGRFNQAKLRPVTEKSLALELTLTVADLGIRFTSYIVQWELRCPKYVRLQV